MLAAPLPTNLLLCKIFAGALYKREVPAKQTEGVFLILASSSGASKCFLGNATVWR